VHLFHPPVESCWSTVHLFPLRQRSCCLLACLSLSDNIKSHSFATIHSPSDSDTLDLQLFIHSPPDSGAAGFHSFPNIETVDLRALPMRQRYCRPTSFLHATTKSFHLPHSLPILQAILLDYVSYSTDGAVVGLRSLSLPISHRSCWRTFVPYSSAKLLAYIHNTTYSDAVGLHLCRINVGQHLRFKMCHGCRPTGSVSERERYTALSLSNWPMSFPIRCLS
jgi:hypothetical protein